MAEYVEVMEQKRRMCQSVLCCRCDIYRLCGEDLSKCQQFIYNNPKKAEDVIMSWAAKHPEPVYPTWAEWLKTFGVVEVTKNKDKSITVMMKPELLNPIPDDIAQKLGLEPKEE